MAEKFNSNKALPWIIVACICWFMTINILMFVMGGLSNRTYEGIISSDPSINILKVGCLIAILISVLLTLKAIRVGAPKEPEK